MSDELDPILFLGLDVAIKRDTCALVAITPDEKFEHFLWWGHRIWAPPVNLVTQVEPVLHHLFKSFAVAGLWYDQYQAAALIQRLKSQGHGHRLFEVNQQTEMTGAATTLRASLMESRLTLLDDAELRANFSWTAAKQTERGFRIIKLLQSKPIDVIVGGAMSLMGATAEAGHGTYPAWQSKMHVRSPFVFDGIAA